MATDLNKSLNLDTFITNLDEVIKKIGVLNTDLSNLTKTSENASKATEELNKAEKESNDIIEQTNEQNKELEKLKQQNLKTLDKLNVAWSNENKELIASKIALQEENKAVKEHVKEIRNRLKGTDDLNKALETQATTINEATAQNKALRAAVRDVDLTTEEGIKKIEEYNKKIEQNDRIITNSSDAFVQQKRNIGAYHTALNGVRKGFDNAILGAKAFLANPIGPIMQSLVFLFKEFNKALNSSEEGQLALAKATGFFKGIMQSLQNVIFKIAKPLIALFEDPRQAIENIKTDIQEKIFRVFDNLRTISTSLGKILKGVFTLDKNMIAEGAQEATDAAKDLYKETSITYNLVKTGVDIYNDTVKVMNEAAEVENDRTKLQVKRNAFIVEEATLSRDIARQRQIANDAEEDTRTQLMAINKALELTQQLSARRLDDKKEELRILLAEGGLGENAIKDNEDIARLQAEILKLEEQQANQIRTIKKRRESILNTLNKEGEEVQTLSAIKTEAVDAELLGLQSIAALKKRNDEEEAERTNALDNLNKLSNEQKIDGALGLASQSADLTSQIFDDEKAAAYAKAGINIAEGITKAIASKGFFGIAQGALISAAGAVQLAKIAAAEYYTGTDNAKKGLAFVSERGAEIIEDKKGNMRLIPDMSLINLEGGEKVYTAQETKQMMFDDSRIIKELRRQKQTVIVNVNKESYARKYAFKT